MNAFLHLKPLEYKYGPDIVRFDVSNGVMVDATEMGKIFGKRPVDFLRLPSTKELIAFWMGKLDKTEVVKSHFGMPENGLLPLDLVDRSEISEVNQDEYDPRLVQVRKGGAKGGETWLCRKLAIKFAAWCSFEFEDWLLDTIDSLLFGPLGRNLSLMQRVAVLTHERDLVLAEMAGNPIFQKLEGLKREIRKLDNGITKARKQLLGTLQGSFL